MRRAVSWVTVAPASLAAAVALFGATLAAPASGAAPEVTPGKKRCTVTEPRLRELSGLLATKDGYVVINDGTDIEDRKRVFFLDTRCRLVKEVRYSGNGPLDTEDLALSPDGETIWIADTGDNVTSAQRRERVAVWSMPVDGSQRPVLHRLSYPENKPRDAEALLIGDDNKPLIITKVASGKAEIFTPSEALRSGDTDPVPMTKVGEISLPKTSTPNLLNTIGRVAITGAARSPDGSRVVLRTYADAFEYDVSGGNVVEALTRGTPRVTPLADPFGEAISYTPDGKTFLTVSDGGDLTEDDPIEILAYTPSTKKADASDGDGGPTQSGAEKSWLDGLSVDEITYLIATVGVIGALLVGAGIFGIVRARRRPSEASDDDVEPDDPPRGRRPDGPSRGHPGDGPSGGDRRGGVYGGDRRGGGVYGGTPGGVYGGGGGYGGGAPAGAGPARAASGGVYGAGRPQGGGSPRGGGRPAGGVYGGGRPAGGVYGGGQPVGPPPGGHPGRGGGVYGGGRAEPPRRGPAPGEPRAGRHGDGGWGDDRGGYGPPPGGHAHRGDRY